VNAFSPRVLKNASRQLERLEPNVAKRILDQIRWLAQHFDEINPEALKGDLTGLFKYRVGDYRIIYEPVHKERVIVVHEVGHRSKIYKKPKP
jgi:mRNA interferase RelE/StbE